MVKLGKNEIITTRESMDDLLDTIIKQAADIARMRECLNNILIEYKREGSRHPHLQRVVAIQCRIGLQAEESE